MATDYIVRDDDWYRVVVGWRAELDTYFARVFSRYSSDPRPIHQIGTRPGEIKAPSILSDALQGFVSLDADTMSALHHDAAPVVSRANGA